MKMCLKNYLLLLILSLCLECKKDNPKPPVVSTVDITEITTTTAISGGELKEMTSLIASKGICWSTEQNPTTENFKITDFSNSSSFISKLSGLIPNTKYFVRAYAINPAGIGYGDQIEFTTLMVLPKSLSH